MKSLTVRIVLVAAAVGAAAWLTYRTFSGGGEAPPPAGGSDPASLPPAQKSGSDASGGKSDGGEAFDPNAGGIRKPLGATADLGRADDIANATPMPARDFGPPLGKGAEVPLELHFTPGTTTHYRIVNAISQRDRSSGQAGAQRFFADVTTVVEGVHEGGGASIRLTIDALRVQALYPNGFQFDFDSRAPNQQILDHEQAGFAVKPLLAVIGKPIEFDLAPDGGPFAVRGIEDWRDAWFDVVELLQPGSARRVTTPYSDDTVRMEWSEQLFPPVLGGTLEVGAERQVQILRDTLLKTYVDCSGPLCVTHDDGSVFRVEMKATPRALARSGTTRSEQEQAVAKVHIQSDADAYRAAWAFRRDPARLEYAQVDAKYQQWVSWEVGRDESGSAQYAPVFVDVERLTRVEIDERR